MIRKFSLVWWFGFAALGLLLVAMGGTAVAQKKDVLSESAFAQQFERIAAEKYPDAAITASSSQIHVRWPSGADATFFLANAYSKYLASPSQLEAIVLATISQPPAVTHQRAKLLPVIRPKRWLEATRSQLQAAGATDAQISAAVPMSIPIAEDLILIFAEDSDEHVRFVSPNDLSQFGLGSAEEARAVAMENLRAKLPLLQIEGHDGRYKLQLDGTYESSMPLVLNEKTWAGLGLKGHPIVALPARDTVLLCGSDDRDSIASLRSHAKKLYSAADHPISDKLYSLREGRFQLLE